MLPRWRVLVLAGAVVVAGCSSDLATGPAPTPAVQPQFAVGDPVTPPPTLLGEQFTVCNDAGAGAYFDIFEDGAVTPTRTFQILDHTCTIVSSMTWPYNPPDVFSHSVKVTERVPTWWRVGSVHLLVGHEAGLYPGTNTPHPAEVRVDQWLAAGMNTVTAPVSGGRPTPDDFVGSVASFTNIRIPDGTQACATRFFRTAYPKGWVGHNPLELFVTVFGVNAFPGRNLFWLLNSDAGGLTAFGRQAVTALLNASNPAINFGMWPAEVIQVFKDTYGHPELYGDAASRLATRNAQGTCPY